LAKFLGVKHKSFSRGKPSSYTDVFEPWTKDEIADVSRSMSYLYRLFLTQVSQTRPLSIDEIDAIGRGHVWTGTPARERKLVDEEGGLMDAIHRAEELAHLEPGEASYALYPRPTSVLGVPAGVSSRIARLAGKSASKPLVAPDSVLGRQLARIRDAAVVPLLYGDGEPLMLPMRSVDLR